MAVKLFGTDGVRGRANQSPMTAEMALRIGAAVGRYFRNDGRNVHRVLIGKDTRLSGYMFENALTAGLTSTGMNALLVGPIPTPAVGLLTVSMRADLGIMISASHNPAEDNGIKFFGPDGFKLSDEAEADIEKLIIKGVEPAQAGNIGRAKRVDDGRFRYGERLKAALPAGIRLDGLKIVVDCANGAAHRVAPEILWELGANVIPLGVTPNGRNINEGCGSTHPAATQAEVLLRKADLGICLDGDADRVILVDETGAIADGDQILALFARQWKAQGRLAKDSLVATVMSNLGLERFLTGHQIALERTKVGDRYVVAHMRQGGFNLGGEQSGHIVMTDHATTGDGLLAALQFLAELVRSGKKASALCHLFDPVPQLLRNVRISDTERALGASGVKAAIEDAERALQDRGRLLIRKSGTEPMVRVMGECDDRDLLENAVGQIVEALIGEKV